MNNRELTTPRFSLVKHIPSSAIEINSIVTAAEDKPTNMRTWLVGNRMALPTQYKDFYRNIIDDMNEFMIVAMSVAKAYIVKETSQGLMAELDMPEKPADLFSVVEEEEFVAYASSIASTASSLRLRQVKGGWVASLPVRFNNSWSINTFISDYLNRSYMTLSPQEREQMSKNMIKFMAAPGKASDIFDHSKAIDKIVPMKDVLKEVSGPWFDPEKIPTIPPEVLRAFKKYVKGLRIISPPVPRTTAVTGQYIDDEGREVNGPIPSLKHAVDKEAFKETMLNSVRKFTVFIEIGIPLDLAKYITQSEKPSTKDLYLWTTATTINAVSGKKHVSSAMMPFKSIRKLNTNIKQVKKIPGDDGLTMGTDGYIYYIPDTDNIDEMDEKFDHLLKQDSGDYAFNDYSRLPRNQFTFGETRESKEKAHKATLENEIVYVDWVNRKINYNDGSSIPRVMDIEGFQKLNATTIARFMDHPVFQSGGAGKRSKVYISLLRHLLSFAQDEGLNLTDAAGLAKAGGDMMPEGPGANTELDSFFVNKNLRNRFWDALKVGDPTGMFNAIVSNSLTSGFRPGQDTVLPSTVSPEAKDAIESLAYSGKITMGDITLDAPILPLRALARCLMKVYKLVKQDEAKLLKSRSIPNACQELGFIYTWGKYNSKLVEVKKADKMLRAPYLDTGVAPDRKPRPVPYMRKNRMALPHQNQILGELDKDPKFAMLDVKAGGGKTFCALKDILNLLSKGKIKRPLVISPPGLVKNYFEDAIYFFGGRVNMVAITNKTMKKYKEDGIRRVVAAAPANSIFVSDYYFLSSRNRDVFYGFSQISVSLNAELLREFGFDYIVFDESHWLKNIKSNRTQATQRLVTDIPYRREMSGTLISGQVTDTVGQFSIFDPSLFGDYEEFLEQYAATTKGKKALSWNKDAEKKIAAAMSENCKFIRVSRKQWAALLPHKIENVHTIRMTPNQKSVYEAILRETVEEIKSNPDLMKKLKESDEDDDAAEMLEMLLRPYLQRLEIYLSAPDMDAAGAEALRGEDLVGPKAKETVKLIREHLSKKVPGKILIFTSFRKSAESVYNALPADLKAMTVHYHAENQSKDKALFERSDKYKIMIGVENSLKEGFNMQMVSRIIRLETVWNPGPLEQAESRINRPDPKNLAGFTRKEIFLDWIIVDHSIDITKMARLISKTISKVKFDESENHLYDGLESLPIVPMTLENIQENNSFETSGLVDYLEQYRHLKVTERDEFAEYVKRNPNSVRPIPIETTTKRLKGDGFLVKRPYINDMVLPYQDELGLVPFSDYYDAHAPEDMDLKDYVPIGVKVHTEYGDGIVVKGYNKSLRVKLALTGKTVSVYKLRTFIMTKEPKSKSILRELADRSKLPPVVPEGLTVGRRRVKKIDTDTGETPRRRRKGTPREDELTEGDLEQDIKGKVNLYIAAVYGLLAVGIFEEEPEITEADLKKFKFFYSGPYLYANIRTKQQYEKFLDSLYEHYKVRRSVRQKLDDLRKSFERGRNQVFLAHRAMKMDLTNFYRFRMRPTKKGWLRPYPIVYEHDLYIAFRTQKQPSVNTVRQHIRVPGVRWGKEKGEWMAFARDKNGAIRAIKAIQKEGYEILNLKEVKEELAKLKFRAAQAVPNRSEDKEQ